MKRSLNLIKSSECASPDVMVCEEDGAEIARVEFSQVIFPMGKTVLPWASFSTSASAR